MTVTAEKTRLTNLEIGHAEVWSTTMEDRPGALAEKLSALAEGGANLQFVNARRDTSQPGVGVVYVAGLEGAAQTKAAKQAGFTKAADMGALRIEVADKPGVGAAICRTIGDAGISLRGLCAGIIGRKCVIHAAFDSVADAKKAMKILSSGK